jgi:hypothetical protein
MLFAVKYQSRPGRTEAESHRLRQLLVKWDPPEGVDIRHHFHYVSGGGVLIVETDDPAALYVGMGPFKSLLDFDTEPVINFLEAVAIAADLDAWAASAVATPRTRAA